MKRGDLLISLCLILAIGVADAVLKFFAIQSFPNENDPALSQLFAFALHKNPGITFDIALPLPITLIATCAIITVLITRLPKVIGTQPIVGVGFFAIIIGALNNMIDRITNGFTTDYLMFFHTSVINCSDLLILFGAIITLVYYKTNPQRRT